jgi:hypothetical protein
MYFQLVKYTKVPEKKKKHTSTRAGFEATLPEEIDFYL